MVKRLLNTAEFSLIITTGQSLSALSLSLSLPLFLITFIFPIFYFFLSNAKMVVYFFSFKGI